MSRIGGSWGVCSSWSGYTFRCSCHCGLQVSRFSRTGTVTQKSLSRCGRNSGGRSFVVFYFGTVDLAVSKEATSHQALPPALSLGTWRPGFLSRPSVQTDNTPPKVNYVLCLLIAECSPGPSDDLPSANPSACRPGTWIFVHGDSYHLTTEEDSIPVDHCDPRSIQPSWCDLYLHSCSTLLRFSTALFSAVKSLQAK